MTSKELEKILLAYRSDYSSTHEVYPERMQAIDAILNDLQRVMSIDKEWVKNRIQSFFYTDTRKFKKAGEDVQRIGNVDFQFFTNAFTDQRTDMQRIADRLKNFLNKAIGISFGNFVSVDVYVNQLWIIFTNRFTIKVNIFEDEDFLEED